MKGCWWPPTEPLARLWDHADARIALCAAKVESLFPTWRAPSRYRFVALISR